MALLFSSGSAVAAPDRTPFTSHRAGPRHDRRSRPEPESSVAYDAFISYSQEDEDLAEALQSALHQFAKPWNQWRALAVFRDESSLAPTPALEAALQLAMDVSRYFILIASPSAADSCWVNREVRYWLSTRSLDTLILVLADGNLSWPDGATDFPEGPGSAAPDALRGAYAQEPLFVDLTWARSEDLTLDHRAFRSAVATIAAPLHDQDKEHLDGTDLRLHRRTRRLWSSAITAVAVLAVTTAATGTIASVNEHRASLARADAAQSRRMTDTERVNLKKAKQDVAEAEKVAEQKRAEAVTARVEATTSRQRATKAKQAADLAAREAGRQRRAATVAASRARESDAQARRQAKRAADAAQQADANLRLALKHAREAKDNALLAARNAAQADANARDALANSLAAKAQVSVENSPEDAQLLALAAIDTAPNPAAVDAARVALMTPAHPPLTMTGHAGVVTAVDISPDGALLAGAASDGTVQLWDPRTGRLVGQLTGDGSAPFVAVAFNPDGTVLAAATNDGRINVWAVATRRPAAELMDTDAFCGFTSLAFSPDGTSMATGCDDGAVKLWDTGSHRRTASLTDLPGQVRSVAFAPDGTVAAGMADGTTRLWNTTTGTLTRTLTGKGQPTYAVAFSRDGSSLAVGGEQSVGLWDPATGRHTGDHLGPTGRLYSLEFRGLDYSPDGRLLAAALSDGTAMIWDTHTQQATVLRSGERCELLSVAVAPDGRSVAASSECGPVRVWPTDADRSALTIGTGAQLEAAALNPDELTLASGGADGSVRLWDTTKGTQSTVRTGDGVVVSIAFSQDGARLVYGTATGTVAYLDTRTDAEPVTTLTPPAASRSPGEDDEAVRSVAISPDGQRIAAGFRDGTVHVWDLINHAERIVWSGHETVYSLAFDPHGGRLSIGTDDGSLAVWDCASATIAATVRTRNVTGVAYHPNGQLLATSHKDGAVRFWRAADLKLLNTVSGTSNSISSLAFGPGGRTLAADGGDGLVHIWDVGKRRLLATLGGHSDFVTAVAFDASGRRFASASEDGTVQVMPVLSRWPQELCRRAGRNLTRLEWTGLMGSRPYQRLCAEYPSGDWLTPTADALPTPYLG